MSFRLLPPAPGLCPACAVRHHPQREPHNRDSLHYQYWFYGKNGRWPVWKDAIAHLETEERAFWEMELRRAGAWQEPGVPDVLPTHDDAIGTLTKHPAPSGEASPPNDDERPTMK